MAEKSARPFYGRFAGAYDRMVENKPERCDFIQEVLSKRGVANGSKILDAGCGAGEYSIELARRGYRVAGVDLSPELIAEARKKLDGHLPVTFDVGNILNLSAYRGYDAVLCRGVLNDLTDDQSRHQVYFSFANALRQGGVVIFDVRDWDNTVRRKTQESVYEKTISTDEGDLTFWCETTLDHAHHQLLVKEQHRLRKNSGDEIFEYDFAMRCWTQAELEHALKYAGFAVFAYFGAYDKNIPLSSTDRIVAVGTLAPWIE